jgi:hypothetical protein
MGTATYPGTYHPTDACPVCAGRVDEILYDGGSPTREARAACGGGAVLLPCRHRVANVRMPRGPVHPKRRES